MSARTLRRAALLAPLALLLAACGDDDPTAPADPVDGTYLLALVADRQMPTAVFDGDVSYDGETHEVLIRANSGQLTLTRGGTRYVHAVDLSGWVDGNPSPLSDVSDHGSCTRDGDVLSCESSFYQNLAFTVELRNQAELVIEQDLSGEAAPLPYRYFKVMPD